MSNNTVTKLAAITDAGQFERIATSVLRAAEPSLYANLSHQGVNPGGKTVRAPLDNVGWVRADNEGMLVAVAHTTAARESLEGKWLHDPSKVTPRKKGGKPTQPAGDLIKAIAEIKKLRKDYPGLKATLALTCNREEPAKVRLKAEELAQANDIVLDVWSASRLAQFLDIDADGQAIRFEFFGFEPTRLSTNELHRIGLLSLESHSEGTEKGALVDRALECRSGHTLLAGASGMGKTTLCMAALRDALMRNQLGIVLDDQTIMDATSLEEALGVELRRHSPSLEARSGVTALELCSEAQPLLVVVEDINRSVNPERLLNKLINWVLSGHPGIQRNRWRLMCPVWPRFLVAIDNEKEVNDAGIVCSVGPYTEDEGREAVKRRSRLLGRPMDDLAASAIAQALGNDPLLIGLHDLRSSAPPGEVIAQYVTQEMARTGLDSSLPVADLEDAVDALARQMLARRNLQPSWRDVRNWLDDSAQLNALRALFARGRLLRLTKSARGEVVEARHDRVLYHLLANVSGQELASKTNSTYLGDPYFAEIVGMAAYTMTLPLKRLRDIMTSSPLVAFYALKHAVANRSNYDATAKSAIEQWIKADQHLGAPFSSRRYWGLVVLSEIDSPLIIELTSCFPANDRQRPYLEARFRNGDIHAACSWLTLYSLEVTIPGREELVEHVCDKYGHGLIKAVSTLLELPELPDEQRRGALLLAGYIADPLLASSVRKAWTLAGENRDLAAFLWAAAQVCGSDAESVLGPVCDAWEALPDNQDSPGTSKRSALAAYGVSWGFTGKAPRSALPYFVQRAEQSEALRWPITYMLRCVDDPIAVQHMVEYLAELRRECGQRHLVIGNSLKSDWERLTGERGRRMSMDSKNRLLDISADQMNDEQLRQEAFALWEVSISTDDVDVARAIERKDARYDTALWARARRKDMTVVPELLEKIEKDPAYWWQVGRYLWSKKLTLALGETINKVAEADEEARDEKGGWILPELILSLDARTAESLLLPVWDKIRDIPKFLQVALCVATPKLLQLVEIAVADAADSRKLFEHFSSTAGIHVRGRGITRFQQVEALTRYLRLLSDYDLINIWRTCIERGWHKYANEHLEPILRSSCSNSIKRVLALKDVDLSGLDRDLKQGRPFRAYTWFEEGIRHGASREDLLDGLLKWLRGKQTAEALGIVEIIFSQESNREEFLRLEEVLSKMQDAAGVLDAIQFDIFRRTLS